jgi:predicted RNase H-like HicB family nuclease
VQQAYTIIIERDLETGWLVGDVVELPGCHSEASDLDSLKANLEEAIEAYLAGADPEDLEPTSQFVGTLRLEIPATQPLSA